MRDRRSMASRRGAVRRMGVADDGPPDSANLLFWGDFDSPDTVVGGGVVTTWGDSSGNGFHATQAVALSRPAYNASDAEFGGRPSMVFDGVVGMLASAASVPSQTGMSAYLVYAAEALGAGSSICAIGTASSSRAGIGQFNDSFFGILAVPSAADASATASPAVVTGTACVAAMTANAAAGGDCVIAYLNGVAGGSSLGIDAVAGVTPNEPLYVGGDGAAFANATVACALIYIGVHSPATVALVVAWLQTRYSL